MKIGLVARMDNGGLGILSWNLYKHLPISKVLVVPSTYQNFPERFPNALICSKTIPTLDEIKEFLTDIDLVIVIETPYNWNIFAEAKRRGIKTILIPMYEWLQKVVPFEPDLYLCPSKLDFDLMKGNKKFLPIPIDRKEIEFYERTNNKNFIFVNGHGGFQGRNSLREFLDAIPYIQSDIKIFIFSQVPFQGIADKRIAIAIGEVDYQDLWRMGDIYVHLHKFDGLSLPLNEALSAGYPIIASDIYPANEYLPKELLIKPFVFSKSPLMLSTNPIDIYLFNPIDIAKKIDEVANMPIGKIVELSRKSNEIAESISWDTLKSVWINTLEDLCKGDLGE